MASFPGLGNATETVVAALQSNLGLNRIELAERSKAWRVAIDDGRLRARTMERYLAVSKLPRNPHWREVLRTAYFVLEQAPLTVIDVGHTPDAVRRALAGFLAISAGRPVVLVCGVSADFVSEILLRSSTKTSFGRWAGASSGLISQ